MSLDPMALFLFNTFSSIFLIVGGLIVSLGVALAFFNAIERLFDRSEKRGGPRG